LKLIWTIIDGAGKNMAGITVRKMTMARMIVRNNI